MMQATPAAHALAPPRTPTRGRPVWMLVVLIAGWVLLRAATWQSALPDQARKLAGSGPGARPSTAPVGTPASADGELLNAAMPGLPQDVRAGLSPEVADEVARELPHELAHQLAIETAREMARAMAPGLAVRLLQERGLGRLAQTAAPVGAAGYETRPVAAARGADRQRPRLLAVALAPAPAPAPATVRPAGVKPGFAAPGEQADVRSFRLSAAHKAAPASEDADTDADTDSSAEPGTKAGSRHKAEGKSRGGSWLAMLPELLLHPGRMRGDGARESLAKQVQSFNPSPRLSADAWLLLRGGSAAAAVPATPLAAGTAGYGGSQSGAVLRYRLFLEDPRRLSAFLRVSSATYTSDREATLGLSARPVGSIPILLQAEARLQSDGNGSRLRPAVQAVSQFPPLALPLGWRGEVYAAGGYVGGRGATPFYDAQSVVDHPLFGIGRSAEFRLGGGAWAGGQKGVGRVDVGPRASVTFRVKRISVRAAVDYRARVAGHAAPGSGPALTLSAGF